MRATPWIAAATWLACQAQAQTAPIESTVLAAYAGKNLAIVTHVPPKISLMTWDQVGVTVAIPGLSVLGAAVLSGVATGARDAAASNTRSNATKLREYSFSDPAPNIAQALIVALKSQIDVSDMPGIAVATDNTVDSLVASAPSAQWLLEVRTDNWGMLYFPTDWSHYRVNYQSSLRVVDAASKRVLAESVCKTRLGESRRPNLAQLATKEASLLRFYFQQAQFECTDQFATKVFGLRAPPRPADALTDYRDHMRTDDETAVPDILAKGQEDYKKWLESTGPKAFAIADNGKWGRGIGHKPADPTAPADVAIRALYNCKQYAKQRCRLYAVNGQVVEGSDFAERMASAFEKSVPAAIISLAAATTNVATNPPSTNATPSGFAKVDEFDLVPYLSDKGRAAYKAWLEKPSPKAFSISPTGHYGESVGTKPKDTTLPSDPQERSLVNCNKNSPIPCRLYAVDNDVVFAWD